VLIEEQADGKIQFAFSNLPAGTSRLQAVRLWKSRWPMEQGYQQMKEELDLNHFEGRSWRGFHHHACLVMFGLWVLGAGATAREGGPGIVGERKRPGAEDHVPGDPPGHTATVETGREAGLRILQSLLSFANSTLPNLNGVVLKALLFSTSVTCRGNIHRSRDGLSA